ncbi:MAG: hypothetical protein J6Y80_04710, partial [Victivallales bacterium]|nr:hypothetical protein [Victivallales bacterium]
VEALRGKTVNYHFTIKEVHGFTPAEQTPELFKQYGCEDLAGMKKLMRQRMEDQNDHNAVRKMNDEILAKLVDGLDFPLPPSVIAHQLEHAMEHELEHFKRDELTEEQIAEKRPAKEAEVRAQLEREFRTNLVLERIADVEKLQVPPENFYQYCYGMAQQSGMNPEEFMKKVSGNSAMLNNIFGNLLRMKALEFVREHVKGAQPPAEQSAEEAPAATEAKA